MPNSVRLLIAVWLVGFVVLMMGAVLQNLRRPADDQCPPEVAVPFLLWPLWLALWGLAVFFDRLAEKFTRGPYAK